MYTDLLVLQKMAPKKSSGTKVKPKGTKETSKCMKLTIRRVAQMHPETNISTNANSVRVSVINFVAKFCVLLAQGQPDTSISFNGQPMKRVVLLLVCEEVFERSFNGKSFIDIVVDLVFEVLSKMKCHYRVHPDTSISTNAKRLKDIVESLIQSVIESVVEYLVVKFCFLLALVHPANTISFNGKPFSDIVIEFILEVFAKMKSA